MVTQILINPISVNLINQQLEAIENLLEHY